VQDFKDISETVTYQQSITPINDLRGKKFELISTPINDLQEKKFELISFGQSTENKG
jgi:hypothetical protein